MLAVCACVRVCSRARVGFGRFWWLASFFPFLGAELDRSVTARLFPIQIFECNKSGEKRRMGEEKVAFRCAGKEAIRISHGKFLKYRLTQLYKERKFKYNPGKVYDREENYMNTTPSSLAWLA